MKTNYDSDKREPIYAPDGRCIGHLWPTYVSQETKLLSPPKHKVPHLRLVTVRNKP